MTLGPDRRTSVQWALDQYRETGILPSVSGGDGSGEGVGDGAGDGSTGDKGTEGDKGSSDGADKGSGDGKPPGKEGAKPKPVTVEIEGVQYVLQDHANRLIGDAREDGRKSGKKAVEDDLRTKALKDQNDYKALYEDEKQKREEAERKVAQAEIDALRQRIGTKHKLPATLIARLQGSTEAEIETDAKALAKDLQPTKAPDTEAGDGTKVRQRDDGSGDKKTADTKQTFTFQSPSDVSW